MGLGSCSVNAATHTNVLWSFLALEVIQIAAPAAEPTEELELQLRDFSDYVRSVSSAAEGEQALHLAALFKGVRFILTDTSAALREARRRLQKSFVNG